MVQKRVPLTTAQLSYCTSNHQQGHGILHRKVVILEMSLQLDWSPAAVNSIDWTLFRKKHTLLYEVPQFTMHVRAETLP